MPTPPPDQLDLFSAEQRAVAAAVRLGSRLPADSVLALLRHADPRIRADACGCARSVPAVISTMNEVLEDLHAEVAYALASLGRAQRCCVGCAMRPHARRSRSWP